MSNDLRNLAEGLVGLSGYNLTRGLNEVSHGIDAAEDESVGSASAGSPAQDDSSVDTIALPLPPSRFDEETGSIRVHGEAHSIQSNNIRAAELRYQIRMADNFFDSGKVRKGDKAAEHALDMIGKTRWDTSTEMTAVVSLARAMLVKRLNTLLGNKAKPDWKKVERTATAIITEDLKSDRYGLENATLCFVLNFSKIWPGFVNRATTKPSFRIYGDLDDTLPVALYKLVEKENGESFADLRRACYSYIAYARKAKKDEAGAIFWQGKLSEEIRRGSAGSDLGTRESEICPPKYTPDDIEAQVSLVGADGRRLILTPEKLLNREMKRCQRDRIYLIIFWILGVIFMSSMTALPFCFIFGLIPAKR